MADEAVMIEDSGLNPVQRTIVNESSGTDIEKHTIMKLADNNLVSASTGSGDIFGGILATEKIGGDGSTTIGAHMNGVFDLLTHIGSAIAVGEQVTSSGANLIRAATESEVQLGKWIGHSEEAASTGTAETIRVRLRGG